MCWCVLLFLLGFSYKRSCSLTCLYCLSIALPYTFFSSPLSCCLDDDPLQPMTSDETVSVGGTVILTCRVAASDNSSLQWSNTAQQTLYFGEKRGKREGWRKTFGAATREAIKVLVISHLLSLANKCFRKWNCCLDYIQLQSFFKSRNCGEDADNTDQGSCLACCFLKK